MEAAVDIERVTKSFGQHKAVDDLSLRVPVGSVYGFIGPNGSGKTTTLRMIMRIYRPDDGTVTVLGDAAGREPDDRVAYLPEERSLYKQMTLREAIRFAGRLKGYNPPTAEIDDHLERLGLGPYAKKRIDTLSKGMNQKAQFIATIIARPQVVLLDEPFSGLDPVNSVVLRDMIREMRQAGTTVIFSTHDMNTAEEMCDRIFMIYKGNKVLDGPLAEIQQEHGEDIIRINGQLDTADLPGVQQVIDYGNLQELHTAADADPQAILSALQSRGAVTHFEVKQPRLHDIFVRIAGAE